jgi:hypothetical protein
MPHLHAASSPASGSSSIASEYGRTIADARRLLRKAKYCTVFFNVSETSAERRAILRLSKKSVLEQLSKYPAEKVWPCELSFHAYDGHSLSFGGYDAVSRADDARGDA